VDGALGMTLIVTAIGALLVGAGVAVRLALVRARAPEAGWQRERWWVEMALAARPGRDGTPTMRRAPKDALERHATVCENDQVR